MTKFTLSDEQWRLVCRELPRGELRTKLLDYRDDAMTWGESEAELDADEVKELQRFAAFDWLDAILTPLLDEGEKTNV